MIEAVLEDSPDENNTQKTEFINVIPVKPEAKIEDDDDCIVVNVAGQFSLKLPANFTYSTDTTFIRENRVLIAMLDDGTADLNSPYSATESITVLIGKEVSSSDDADSVAASIGLENGNVLQDVPSLNIRYAVKEAGESLSIYLALICTDSNSYPAQLFFNNAIGVDTEKLVSELLESIKLGNEPVFEAREERVESYERVDLAEEKTLNLSLKWQLRSKLLSARFLKIFLLACFINPVLSLRKSKLVWRDSLKN